MEIFPGVEIVVINYKTPGDLWGFLHSYATAVPEVPHSLHVVNVCPTPADLGVVRDWANDFSFLHTSFDENVGYARACNYAGAQSDREALSFFNADTRLSPGVVESCYRKLMSMPEYAILGPRQVDDENRITSAGVFGTRANPALRGWNQIDDSERFSDVREDAVSVSGSAFFVKRSAWDELTECRHYMGCPEVWLRKPQGPFLPTQHYYEETYLAYHALEHGYKVVYYGPAKMIHRWHKASPIGSVEGLHWKESKALFVAATEFHGIPHD